MIRITFIVLSALVLSKSSWAQTELLPVSPSPTTTISPTALYYNAQMHSWLIGGGGLLLRDSYLSPLGYGGYTLSIINERSHFGYRPSAEGISNMGINLWPSRLRTTDERWLHHQMMSFDYGLALSPARNASIRRLQFRIDRGLTYRTFASQWGQLSLGGGLTAGIGGYYHSRNGNNPATAKVDLALTANLIYTYQIPWRRLPLRLTVHNTAELLGLAFAQGFGENYYELYRYQTGVLAHLHLTHPINRLANQLRIRMDIPLGESLTIALGYRCQMRSWRLNHTINNQLDHTAYIGMVSYMQPLGGRKAQTSKPPLPF